MSYSNKPLRKVGSQVSRAGQVWHSQGLTFKRARRSTVAIGHPGVGEGKLRGSGWHWVSRENRVDGQ